MKVRKSKPKTKPETVNITRFHPILVPTSAQTLDHIVWGLGDDNKMYMWDTKTSTWISN